MIRRYLPKSTEELIHWYERYISPIALVAGFLLDNFVLLREIDSLQSYLLLTFYMVLAGLGIAVLNLIETGRFRGKVILAIAPFLPVVIQFAFGGLFSGFLSVYSRSASIAVSWIFVLVIAGLLIGNERFRTYYVRFPFQISVYFITLFSFFIFLLPIVFKSVGPAMFFLSLAVSIGVIVGFLYLMRSIVPEVVAKDRTRVARSIASIVVVFIVLYFTNAIPPLPLALKDAGVYHTLTREGDVYVLTEESSPWYRDFIPLSTTYHRVGVEGAYVFTSIYAPSGIDILILHEWQRKSDSGAWVTDSIVPFQISGGREEGYRGYSHKSVLPAGKWRVNVLTKTGQIIGRINFVVVSASSTGALSEVRQ